MPIEKDDYYPEDNIDVEPIAYDNFQLVSPLGGLFRYYTSDGTYWREALNDLARWTQPEDDLKCISRSVYEFAHRMAVKEGER